jgi:hypothetical protein
MKPKHYIAFLAVLGSLCWFAVMVASQVETLITAQARFVFLFSFIVALLVGVIGLTFLFTQTFRKN